MSRMKKCVECRKYFNKESINQYNYGFGWCNICVECLAKKRNNRKNIIAIE